MVIDKKRVLNLIHKIQKEFGYYLKHPSEPSVNDSYFSVEIEKYYSELPPTLPENDVVNHLYSFLSETKKGLNEENCKELYERIQKLIIRKTKSNPYTTKLALNLNLFNEKNAYLSYCIYKYIDVMYVTQKVLFKKFDVEPKVVGYKIDWAIGSKILLDLKELPKYDEIEQNLIEDLKDHKNVQVLVENFVKNTPTVNLKGRLTLEDFFTKTTLHVLDPELIHVMILMTLRNMIRYEIIGINLYENKDQVSWFKILVDEYNHKTNRVGDDSFTTLNRIKVECINAINIYAKIIGVEITTFLKKNGIIKQEFLKVYHKKKEGLIRNNQEDSKNKIIKKYFYTFNQAGSEMIVAHKLPIFYLPKEIPTETRKIIKEKTKKFVGYTIFNKIIEKDGMDCVIHDSDMWYNAQGKFYLNLSFIEEFLITLMGLYSTVQKKGALGLSDKDLNFLNAFYRINFKVFDRKSKDFVDLVEYSINFKNLDKYEKLPMKLSFEEIMENDEENDEETSDVKFVTRKIRARFVNKIYQQKHLFKYILENLEVLLYLDFFQHDFVFDQRGRAYPQASLMNHMQPVFKYFFSWKNNLTNETTKTQRIKNIIRAQLIAKMGNKLLETDEKALSIKHFCLDYLGKNLYECFLLAKDMANIIVKQANPKQNIQLESYYSVDASSSGFQINAILLRSKKLADACGITSNTLIEDIYMKFVDEFHKKKILVTEIVNHFGRLGLSEFIMEYFRVLEKDKLGAALKLEDGLSLDDEELIKYDLTKLKKKLFILVNHWYASYKKNPEGLTTLGDEAETHVNYNVLPINLLVSLKSKYEIDTTTDQLVELETPRRVIKAERVALKVFRIIFCLTYEKLLFIVYKKYTLYVNRKLIKHGIMTLFYGSSNSTRRKNYVDNYIDQIIESEITIKEKDETEFAKFARLIDRTLLRWVNQKYPEALILKKLFVKFNSTRNDRADDDLFKPSVIKNEHSSWYYKPLVATETFKSIYGVDYRLQKFTSEINRKKLKSSFLANYIQFCDASICADVTRIMAKKKIPLLTVHDCFRCPHEYYEELNNAIYQAYKNFYNQNPLYTHFSVENPKLIEELNHIKITSGIEPFSVEEIMSINLCKY